MRWVIDYFCAVFFFNDAATTDIYTLSLHDALPIWRLRTRRPKLGSTLPVGSVRIKCTAWRSEERFSRNAETDLVCRLLLEKKKPVTLTLLGARASPQAQADTSARGALDTDCHAGAR